MHFVIDACKHACKHACRPCRCLPRKHPCTRSNRSFQPLHARFPTTHCRGAPRKFLDALLSASRLELFRPGVDLLAAGDAVNELFVVVAGKVEMR